MWRQIVKVYEIESYYLGNLDIISLVTLPSHELVHLVLPICVLVHVQIL